MSPNSIVRVKDLRKTYGELTALRGTSLSLQQGELVVIIGPSKTGKRTLLCCINLVYQTVPT